MTGGEGEKREVWSIAHTFSAEGVHARIYQFVQSNAEAVRRGHDVAHLVVFAQTLNELDDADPQLQGYSPIDLHGLIEVAKAASAVTDYHEGRSSMIETAARLRNLDVFEDTE